MIILFLIIAKAQIDCHYQIEACDPLNCIIQNCEYKPQFITLNIDILTFQNVFIQLPNEDLEQNGNFKIQARNLSILDSQIEKLFTFNNDKPADFIIQVDNVLFNHVTSITAERIIITGNKIFINSSNFNIHYFHMIGQNTVVQLSTFESKLRKCKGNCNCEVGLCDLSEAEQYKEYTDFLSNFTFSIQSNATRIINSTIKHSGIGLRGNLDFNQYSLFSSSGLGCDAQQGFGCGFNDWVVSQKLKCGSSGGSYGEIGKSPRSEVSSFSFICDQLLPRQPYGDMFFPVFEGSGGGGKYFGGPGGGIIFITGKYLKLDGRIEADGQPPVRQEDLTYGGGSGGSILIYGSIDGEAKLSSKGGILAKRLTQISGDGGGGRIAVWNNDFFHSLSIELGFGTLYQTPCLQMYQLKDFKCVPCDPGYYNMMIDNSICKRCLNYNLHSVFQELQKTPFCLVQSCLDNYVLYDNDCITYSENVVRTLGGENLIFGIVVVVVLIIINVIIIAFIIRVHSSQVSTSQATFVSDFDSNDEQNKDQASSIPHFVVEDLPYFVKRIYLQGSNTIEFPWEVGQNPDLFEYTQFIDQINEAAQYNKFEQVILGFFYYFYFPFYHFLLQYLQKRKYINISQKFLKTKAQTAQDIRNGFFAKISSSSDHTLAHIDIMNYNNNILDWSNKTTFPVTLILNGYGTFLFPWQINSRDPLIKSLQLSFQKFKLFDQSIQGSYLDEVAEESSEEEITSFEEFINKFNKLCVRIDIRQSQTEFLKHSIEVLEFIDDANEDIFLKKKILVDICFHILGENQSSLIMLSTRHMREIQQTLKEIHSLFNFNPEYQIKISINFDKIKLLPRYFDNQIIVRTAKDINEQIIMYQKYEEDKEELNNLKLQMQRRMEAEGLLSPLLEEQTYIISNVKGKQNNKRNLQKLILQTQRALALTSSFYVRYRTKRFNDKILTLLLIFLFFFSLFMDISYIFLLVSQFEILGNKGVIITEFIFQLIVFPLSWMLSPAFLLYWMFKPQNENGKRFLLINFSCLFNTVFLLIFGFIELAQSLIQNGNNRMANFCLLKPVVFINYNVVAYIGSFYLNK